MVNMNRLPTKQIYLLIVIIVGIIALSVYSTYAIFTFESETSDAFNIKLPSTLEIKTDMYEYKQIEIPKNSFQTTDIDLYNTYDYELCYSIWYKTLNTDSDVVNIYEISNTTLKASGTISAQEKSRFTLLITNDSDEDVKVNLGLAATKASGTCSLKLSSDKKNIREIYDQEITTLKEHIISNRDQVQIAKKSGSLIYRNKSLELLYSDSITIASKYTIENNHYTLLEPEEIVSTNYNEFFANIDYQTQDYFICSNQTCDTIYRINTATVNEKIIDETNTSYTYLITNVDEYEIYQQGTSGIKQVKKDYYYYGDNPNNFVYYNCQTNDYNSCELWRIIGLIYDEEADDYFLKIVRNDSIGNYQYNQEIDNNTWYNEEYQSTLYEHLNKTYGINNSLSSIYPHTFEEIPDLNLSITELSNVKITPKAEEITIMNLSDYLHASTCSNGNIADFTTCLNDNWLNRITIPREWTLTALEKKEELVPEPIIEEEQNEELPEEPSIENQPFEEENPEIPIQPDETPDIPEVLPPPIIESQMYTVGKTIEPFTITNEAAVRPVVYLISRALYYSGEGTLDNPYIIK